MQAEHGADTERSASDACQPRKVFRHDNGKPTSQKKTTETEREHKR